MLGEFKVSRCSRRCHALDRPLREGEVYYSVLIESGDDFVRRDFSAEAWEGPPPGAIGWWKNRMPTADEKKMVLAPREVLIDLLRQMADAPEQAKSRYLLALLLLRRRWVRPSETLPATTGETTLSVVGEGPRAADEDDSTAVLRIEVPGDGEVMEILVCEITREESARLREELDQLIYCEAED